MNFSPSLFILALIAKIEKWSTKIIPAESKLQYVEGCVQSVECRMQLKMQGKKGRWCPEGCWPTSGRIAFWTPYLYKTQEGYPSWIFPLWGEKGYKRGKGCFRQKRGLEKGKGKRSERGNVSPFDLPLKRDNRRGWVSSRKGRLFPFIIIRRILANILVIDHSK